MRRIVTLIFTLFYALLSTGAPTLLHFCGHEQNVHLSVAHEDYHSAPSCCHSEVKSCHAPQPKSPASVDEEDCCVSSNVQLDESQFESQEFALILHHEGDMHAFDIPVDLGSTNHTTRGPVQNNGPPLYLKHQQIIVYS